MKRIDLIRQLMDDAPLREGQLRAFLMMRVMFWDSAKAVASSCLSYFVLVFFLLFFLEPATPGGIGCGFSACDRNLFFFFFASSSS